MRLVDCRSSTPTPSKVRRSLDSQSVTSFHICALSQANVDDAVEEITKAVKLHAPSEIVHAVQAEYLDKFSQQELDDINALSCDEVEITIGNVQLIVNESQ